MSFMKIRFSHCSILGCLFVLERILVWFNKVRGKNSLSVCTRKGVCVCLSCAFPIFLFPVENSDPMSRLDPLQGTRKQCVLIQGPQRDFLTAFHLDSLPWRRRAAPNTEAQVEVPRSVCPRHHVNRWPFRYEASTASL